ncbi:DUF1573 domain-containing protein [Lentisphaerota bacterium WC36G]|nr:DUF1573 domain-containing protein [Lentisphaerae bacterium WC36]
MKIKIVLIVLLSCLIGIHNISATSDKPSNNKKISVENSIVLWVLKNFPEKTKKIKYNAQIKLMDLLVKNKINDYRIQELIDQSQNLKSKFYKNVTAILSEKISTEQKMIKSHNLIKKYLANFETKVKVFNTQKDEFTVGSFKRNEIRIVNFTLKNNSKKAIKISQLRKTCGCAKVSSSNNEIKPNESAIVTVKLIANKELSGPFIKSIYVVTEAKKLYKFTVIGNAGH